MPCKMKIFITAVCTLAAATAAFAASATAEKQIAVERYAVYVASNEGGDGRETLWYAGSDAVRFADTMTEIGGIPQENSYLLLSPTKQTVDRTVDEIADRIRKSRMNAKRTEFIFYYSGHSDENALLFGKHSYGYEALKERINEVPSDVHVVILDSCFSGNFVRAKGGQRQKSFLVDDSNIVKGHAYLTSSSESEASQESDSIQASFFSHAMVTGLRGAADTSGDGKVSLNELYYYAFNETLALTENSSIGPQHPAYNITLVGSGDLVLTDITSAESVLVVPSETEGKFLIRTQEGRLVSEINKITGSKMALALPAGSYIVTVITAATTAQTSVVLKSNETYLLDSATLKPLVRVHNTARGADNPEPEKTARPALKTGTPVVIGFVPGLTVPFKPDDLVNLSANLLVGKNTYVTGVQASGLISIVTQDMEGIQGAGWTSVVGGTMTGVQGSGLVNTSGTGIGIQGAGLVNVNTGDFKGVQGAGLVNVNKNAFKGVQGAGLVNTTSSIVGLQAAGIVNVADTVEGVQIAPINFARHSKGAAIGLLNIILDGIMSPAFYFDTEGNMFLQYQGGTKAFYTTWLAGTGVRNAGSYAIAGFGIGCRAGWKHVSFDTELLWKSVFDTAFLSQYNEQMRALVASDASPQAIDAKGKELLSHFSGMNIPSARVTANLSIFKHLSFFAAFTADLHVSGWNDKAFAVWGHRNPLQFTVSDTAVALYPSFSFGMKF